MFKEFLRQVWYTIGKLTCKIICLPFFRISVSGRENVPSKGSLLLLSNHQSFLDPILCQVPIRRNFRFIVRDSLIKAKFFGPLIASYSTIPIKQGHADISAMKKVINVLKQNQAVCLFPEGSRTPDGKIADIKPGFGLISRRSGATIVPIVIEGAFQCWPRHKKLPSIGRVSVCYGKPITPEKVKDLDDKEFAGLLTRQLREMQTQCRIKLGKQLYDYSGENSG